jgi:hypothetical protein
MTNKANIIPAWLIHETCKEEASLHEERQRIFVDIPIDVENERKILDEDASIVIREE